MEAMALLIAGIPILDTLEQDLKNHSPYITPDVIPLAIEAISCGYRAEYDRVLDLIKMTGRGGWMHDKMTAREVITALSLWDFLDEDVDEDCQETDPRDPVPNEW